MKGAGIYIHIPFCIKKCHYCDFCSVLYDHTLLDLYVDTLIKEIDYRRDETCLIDSIYFGGGTPSLLDDYQISKVLETVNNAFTINKNCEITLEANPASYDLNRAKRLIKSCINRISIGIQSLNDDELKILGRIHDKKKAVESIEIAKDAGFKNISVDLIYGVSNQDLLSWSKTLKEIISLNPQHISTYELTFNENTLISRDNRLQKASEEVIEKIYLYTVQFLTKSGFIHYEISNYSREGFHSVHNMNYWTRGKYIGFGVSAHSFDGFKRSANTSDINDYIALINDNKTATKDMEYIDEEKAKEEQIFLGLRTINGINKELLKGKDGIINRLYRGGLIEFFDDRIRLTSKGLILSNEIILQVL